MDRVSKVSVIAPSKAFGDIKMADVDARLAEEVQKYNHLYESSLKEYKDSVRTSNSWKEIADSIGEEVEFCKKKWRYMRESFVRAKKK